MSYTDCQKWLVDHGLRYPKTCKLCGLSEPCRYPGKGAPTTPESLHLAICQAVTILNSCPDADACRANMILRTALDEYVESPKAPEARAGDCGAVNLEQFRAAVAGHHIACRRKLRHLNEGKYPESYRAIFQADLVEADRLLTLIDSTTRATP